MPSLTRHDLRRLLIGLTGMALLTAAGCGGGGKSSTTTVPATSHPVNTTPPAPGAAQLQSVVVQPGDLPAGWAAKPPSPSANQVADDTAFDQCMNAPNTTGDIVAVAYSPNYVKGTSTIDSSATSFKSPSDVEADTHALLDPKASTCLEQVGKARLTAGLPKGTTLKTDTIKITTGTNGGPTNEIATATSTVSLTANGHTLTLNVETVYLIAPRIEAHIDFFSEGTPIPTLVKQAVVNKVAVRVMNGS